MSRNSLVRLIAHRSSFVWFPKMPVGPSPAGLWGPIMSGTAAPTPPFSSRCAPPPCHWCHVMEHESFEDPETARLLNEHFVPVKVDREERPDLDAIYMTAVQALNHGQGGWPMSVWLTPDLKPFYAGTYFPP